MECLKKLKINANPAVAEKIGTYPPAAQKKLKALRKLILKTAKQLEAVEEIEETLKWQEPSYLVKKGSTIRIDWKAKTPNQYAIYFKCTSKLVMTFREVYGDLFEYEKNRAIVFQMNDLIPVKELESCIAAALTYHSVKEVVNLGIEK